MALKGHSRMQTLHYVHNIIIDVATFYLGYRYAIPYYNVMFRSVLRNLNIGTSLKQSAQEALKDLHGLPGDIWTSLHGPWSGV